MDAFQIISSNKGKRILLRAGHAYNEERIYKEKIIWRCRKYHKNKCPARIHSTLSSIIKTVNIHHKSCSPDPEETSKLKLYDSMKQHVMENPTERPSMTQAKFSLEMTEPILAKFPDPYHMKKTLYNQRMKNLPPLPKSLEEVVIPEELSAINILDRFNQLQTFNILAHDSSKESGNDRFFIFTIEPHIERLRNCKIILADGTFDSVPKINYQLYTIHGVIGDIAPPLFYALLPNKTQSTYEKMLEAVKKICPEMNPEIILTDFEKAAINAFKNAFPDADAGGCRFHLAQSIMRHCDGAAMKNKYVNDIKFRLRVKALSALSIIPVPLVITFFEILSNDFDESELELLQYFERTYVGALKPRTNERRSPLFPPEFWNLRQRITKGAPTTTNHSEGWHGRLNAHCGKANPDMWKFLNLIKSEILLTENEIMNFNIGGEKNAREYIKTQKKRLQNLCERPIPESDHDRLEYLYFIAEIV